MARQVTLHGTYLAFDGDRPIQRLFVETVTVKGRKIDADAIRTDLNKSFLEGGRNRAWAQPRLGARPQSRPPHLRALRTHATFARRAWLLPRSDVRGGRLMGYARSSKAEAEAEAARRNAESALPWERYVVSPYPDGTNDRAAWPWGVERQIRYTDRPELGWRNGGFVWANGNEVTHR